MEGDLNAQGMRFAIVVARWNSFITERLLQGSIDALRRSGCRRPTSRLFAFPAHLKFLRRHALWQKPEIMTPSSLWAA